MTRRLGATVVGAVTAAVGVAVMLPLGWVLEQRLFGDSTPATVVILVVFGLGGMYAGWLLGLVLFSAVMGPRETH
ncbi:MAG: hypothetical protein J2P45_11470 [Candidatus Dormibacteraeota bacterium]|nr:hypothetical protein [Candidatus Dormibacteraeota bacterium]